MKKFKQLLGLIFILVAASFNSYSQGITGSAHDFSGDAWNATGEICIVCHTPHAADISVADAPLWNHEVTTAVFTLYSSPSLDATDLVQPTASSKLCLSCHDGTVAVDNFGGTTNGNDFITGSDLIGTDLSDDHPISFTYDDILSGIDGGLHAPSTTNSGLGSTIENDLLLAGQLQCSSCHDVHNQAGFNFLLVKDNSGSALCLTCHNK